MEREYELNKYVERELDLRWDDDIPRDVIGKHYLSEKDKGELYGLGTHDYDEKAWSDLGIGGRIDPSTDIMGYANQEDDLFRSLFEDDGKEDQQQQENGADGGELREEDMVAIDPFEQSEPEESTRGNSLDGGPGIDDRGDRADDDEERFARGER